jgi:hypothetical protein
MRACKRAAFVGVLALLAGCSDSGAPDLRNCEVAEQNGDIGQAVEHCQAAAKKGSWWSGTQTKAGNKLVELQPKLEPWKQAEDEKKARQDAEARKRADARRAAAVAQAKQVVRKRPWELPGRRDAKCTAEGLPPYIYDYEGGTAEQNEVLAAADGCARLFTSNASIFCCPT